MAEQVAHSSTLLSVTCPNCGATSDFDPLLEQQSCAHCGVVHRMPEEARGRAVAYQRRLKALWANELEIRRVALLHAQSAKYNPRILRYTLLFALAVPFWLIALGAGLTSVLHPAFSVASVAATLGVFWGLTSSVCFSFRAPSVSLVLASGLCECDQCGAPIRLAEGAAAAHCAYCRATMLTTTDVRQKLMLLAARRLAPARAEQMQAEIENWRTATEAGAVFGVGGRTSVVGISVAALMIGAFVITGVSIARVVMGHDARTNDASWVLPVLVAGHGAILGWAVAEVRRAMRGKREFEATMGRPLRHLLPEQAGD
jgi:hypothetical protein